MWKSDGVDFFVFVVGEVCEMVGFCVGCGVGVGCGVEVDCCELVGGV